MSDRDSFIFYRSFYDCIKELPQESSVKLYEAVFEYIFDGVEPELEGLEKGIFSLIKPQLDANNRRYENGKKGGAPIGNQNARKTKNKQPRNNLHTTQKQPAVNSENNLKQPNVNVNVNENVNENENVNVNQSVLRACARDDGQTDNELLEEIFDNCEFERYKPEITAMLKSAIERIYYSKTLTVGKANLPQSKLRSYLRMINSTILDNVLDKMSKNETRILNPTAYLMSLIVNEICESESDLILSLPPGYIDAENFYAGGEASG